MKPPTKKKVKGRFLGSFQHRGHRHIVLLPSTSSCTHLQRRHAP